MSETWRGLQFHELRRHHLLEMEAEGVELVWSVKDERWFFLLPGTEDHP